MKGWPLACEACHLALLSATLRISSPSVWQMRHPMPFVVLALQRVDLEVAADTDEQPLDSGQAMESAPLMPAQRSKTLKALPPDVAAAAQAAVDSLANADAQVWVLEHTCTGWQICECRRVMQT